MNAQSALQILELRKVDHPDELHAAYRRMVKRWHPDQFADQPEIRSVAEERLKQINLAYSALNQYIKKLGISNLNINKNTSSDKKSSQHPKGDEAGQEVRLRDWIRKVFRKRGYKPRRSQTTAGKRPSSKTTSGAGRSNFDSILRKTRLERKRRSIDTHRIPRRVMSINYYRRRSNPSRVEGLQPVSPVSPIRPVSGIDPIDGSE